MKQITLVCVALLVSAACTSTDAALVTLDGAVAAADAALTVLATQGTVDPITAANVISVISPIPSAASAILAEYQSKDAPEVKVAKIATLTTPIVSALAKINPTAALYVAPVLAAWQAFLAAVEPSAPPPTVTPSAQSRAVVVFVTPSKVSIGDIKKHIAKLNTDLSNYHVKK